ncbi:MAG: hypothetical protein ACRC2T_19785 [Thermoguttaceae bacterium]
MCSFLKFIPVLWLFILFAPVLPRLIGCVYSIPQIPFDSAKWQTSEKTEYRDESYTHRASMIKDLKQNHLRTGMTVDMVKEILGETRWFGYFTPRFFSQHSDEYVMLYDCGPGYDFLVVCFDKKGFYRSSYFMEVP